MTKRRTKTSTEAFEISGDLRAGAAEKLRLDLLEKLSAGNQLIDTTKAKTVDSSIAQVMVAAQRTALSKGREISFRIEDGTPFAALTERLALKAALISNPFD